MPKYLQSETIDKTISRHIIRFNGEYIVNEFKGRYVPSFLQRITIVRSNRNDLQQQKMRGSGPEGVWKMFATLSQPYLTALEVKCLMKYYQKEEI